MWGGTPSEKEKVMTHRASQNPPAPPPFPLYGKWNVFSFSLSLSLPPSLSFFSLSGLRLTDGGVRLWVNVCLWDCLIFSLALFLSVSLASEGADRPNYGWRDLRSARGAGAALAEPFCLFDKNSLCSAPKLHNAGFNVLQRLPALPSHLL